MLKITDVKLSKNTVVTGEKFTISVQIQETVDYRNREAGKFIKKE